MVVNTATILTIIGCRPQFIKAALVSKELRARGHKEYIIHTGQHFDADMSDNFFEELSIPQPDFNLNVNCGSELKNLAAMIDKLSSVMRSLLLKTKIDYVILYGDTTSTLAGATVCSKLRIPIVHIEAGLRSYNRDMPEEQNRIMVDSISDILFAPTDYAYDLLCKGDYTAQVYNVGDVMYDMILQYNGKCLPNKNGKYFLATIHRPQNCGSMEIDTILQALNDLNRKVIWPVHPRIRKYIKMVEDKYSNIYFIEPASYLQMLSLEKHAVKVITDSGGVQKEAYALGVPCVTLRDDTEWIETLDAGANMLCDLHHDSIIDAAYHHVEIQPCTAYGDGTAYIKIADRLSL